MTHSNHVTPTNTGIKINIIAQKKGYINSGGDFIPKTAQIFQYITNYNGIEETDKYFRFRYEFDECDQCFNTLAEAVLKYTEACKCIHLKQEPDPTRQTINFITFIHNFPPNFIIKAWDNDKRIASHLQDKFNGIVERSGESYVSGSSFLSWFSELSISNKSILVEWVNDNYKG